MGCDRCTTLLSARLDGELTEQEAQELEEHLAACPQCRAVARQLEELQAGWDELEELQAPQGFAQDVLYALNRKTKILPLFRSWQRAAMGTVAAAVVLCTVLYSPTWREDVQPEQMSLLAGTEDTQPAYDEQAQLKVDTRLAPAGAVAPDSAALEEEPVTFGIDLPVDEDLYLSADEVLILDRLPDGAAELLPDDAAVAHDMENGADTYTWLTGEELDAIEVLAREQGIPAVRTAGEGEELCALVVTGTTG